MKRLLIISTLLLSFFVVDTVNAQDDDYDPSEERSDFNGRKKSIMDGNQLRATYHNIGHAGRTDGSNIDELIFEFPKNTGREYMYFSSVMIGTEVPDQNTADPDDEFPLVDVATFRTSRQGESWSMNPIKGYYRENSNEMARSDRGPGSPLGNTWPDSWPDKFEDGGDGWTGSWNGFFGRDQFNADVEFYYKSGDDLYTKYSQNGRYRPDATDPTRGGLGVILDTRVLAWSLPLINSVHFNIFEVRNDASYDYNRVAFGLWIADLVAQNASNDMPLFDDIRSIAYLTDTDRNDSPPVFDGNPIGEMGLVFLETPGNAIDGIDNDADSYTYDVTDAFYDPDNQDLYTSLTTNGGGFYNPTQLRDTVIKRFEVTDFDQVNLVPGDKIVLIQEDGSRVITTYPAGGGTVVSQGQSYELPAGGYSIREDLLPEDDPNSGVHTDGFDNDFDGIIDENQPNHLTKRIIVGTNAPQEVPLRFINYLFFQPGDTVQQGLIVTNSAIRERMQNDANFETLVNDYHEGRFQNRFTSAPMMDEGREDYFDNDQDWLASSDDVGIEGDGGSEGSGDGKPTSGAGTSFPGEPSIDKTDVSETDLIGVTRSTIFSAGLLNTELDADIWESYMVPGEFEQEGEAGTDSDIFISSGLFPLQKGSTERFAVAITAAAENQSAAIDRQKINSNIEEARTAYEADYQFARAPSPPIVRAVAEDGRVTLYWDDSAEDSFDKFVADITGDGNDFEGYKIYKSTDNAFESVGQITDSQGSFLYYRPEAIYDKVDGIQGDDPVGVNGTKFNLGTDSGLRYTFVDENVTNGVTYYYAVTSYDYGVPSDGIAPAESPIQISQNPDGSVILGQNVVQVRPTESPAGYVNPENPEATLISGSPGGSVNIEVIDPDFLRADNLYRVVFEDTLVDGGNSQDTLKTKNFSLLDISNGARDTLISKSTDFNGQELPTVDGFRLRVNNVSSFQLNTQRSGWEYEGETEPHGFSFSVAAAPKVGDYEIVIGDQVGFGQSTSKEVPVSSSSTQVLPAIQTNFKIFNSYTGNEIEYAFADLNNRNSSNTRCNPTGSSAPDNYTAPPPGELSAVAGLTLGKCSDIIFFIEDFRESQDTLTYRVELNPSLSGRNQVSAQPSAGDSLKIFITKPFSRNDVFEFRMDPENTQMINQDSAKQQLDEILVIPNPYIVANAYEPATTNTNNQHNRVLRFTNIPVPSTLRIFTVAGVLVEKIDIERGDPRLEGGLFGGSYRWDMLTKDNLEISYGVYIYHIQAPGIGEKTGKFAVIK